MISSTNPSPAKTDSSSESKKSQIQRHDIESWIKIETLKKSITTRLNECLQAHVSSKRISNNNINNNNVTYDEEHVCSRIEKTWKDMRNLLIHINQSQFHRVLFRRIQEDQQPNSKADFQYTM
jgi:hypothetical protein